MPARRAASALPPTASVRRPKLVRLSRTQPTANTSASIQMSTGMPRKAPRKKVVKPVSDTTCVRRPDSRSARPRAEAYMARVAMNGTILP